MVSVLPASSHMPTSHMTFFRLTQEGKKHFLGSVIWGMVMRADISH